MKKQMIKRKIRYIQHMEKRRNEGANDGRFGQKTQTIRKIMDQQCGKITLLWVPGHMGIICNVTKEALNEQIKSIEKYPAQNLTNWIKRKHQKEQQEQWNNRTSYCRATHSAIMNHEPIPECPSYRNVKKLKRK
jgi:hypothetical protein